MEKKKRYSSKTRDLLLYTILRAKKGSSIIEYLISDIQSSITFKYLAFACALLGFFIYSAAKLYSFPQVLKLVQEVSEDKTFAASVIAALIVTTFIYSIGRVAVLRRETNILKISKKLREQEKALFARIDENLKKTIEKSFDVNPANSNN